MEEFQIMDGEGSRSLLSMALLNAGLPQSTVWTGATPGLVDATQPGDPCEHQQDVMLMA